MERGGSSGSLRAISLSWNLAADSVRGSCCCDSQQQNATACHGIRSSSMTCDRRRHAAAAAAAGAHCSHVAAPVGSALSVFFHACVQQKKGVSCSALNNYAFPYVCFNLGGGRHR